MLDALEQAIHARGIPSLGRPQQHASLAAERRRLRGQRDEIPSQKVAYWYALAAMALFAVQVLGGLLAGWIYVAPTR